MCKSISPRGNDTAFGFDDLRCRRFWDASVDYSYDTILNCYIHFTRKTCACIYHLAAFDQQVKFHASSCPLE